MKGIAITQKRFVNRTTAVEKYIVEISKYEILKEEDMRSMILQYKETRSEYAKRKIFESCARFVVTCAKKYQSNNIELMDLINAGNYGVIDALNHFDLSVERCKFISYAMYYVRLHIQNAVSESVELIKMPIKLKQDELNYSQNSSFRSVGRVALQPETFSMDANVSDDSDTQISEELIVSSCWESQKHMFRDMYINDFLNVLNPTEKEVIINCFGLYGYPAKTIERIASMLRLKKQAVSSIRDKALEKMSTLSKSYENI